MQTYKLCQKKKSPTPEKFKIARGSQLKGDD